MGRDDLQRFVQAQERVYESVLRELRAGYKASHWMWFVFPQIEGLGRSDMAIHFAIVSLEEAKAYLAHPILGPRLRECTALVNAVVGKTAREVFGHPDDLKFRSSMTLFALAAPDEEWFAAALCKYFNAEQDAATLARLRKTD